MASASRSRTAHGALFGPLRTSPNSLSSSKARFPKRGCGKCFLPSMRFCASIRKSAPIIRHCDPAPVIQDGVSLAARLLIVVFDLFRDLAEILSIIAEPDRRLATWRAGIRLPVQASLHDE